MTLRVDPVDHLEVEQQRRSNVSDGLNDPDVGREGLTLLGYADIVLVTIVVGGPMDIVGQAHTDQAHRECGQAEQRHDNPLRPACHDICKARPVVHRCQADLMVYRPSGSSGGQHLFTRRFPDKATCSTAPPVTQCQIPVITGAVASAWPRVPSPKTCSVVRRRLKWSYGAFDVDPGATASPDTTV